jgi:hypothetical protein
MSRILARNGGKDDEEEADGGGVAVLDPPETDIETDETETDETVETVVAETLEETPTEIEEAPSTPAQPDLDDLVAFIESGSTAKAKGKAPKAPTGKQKKQKKQAKKRQKDHEKQRAEKLEKDKVSAAEAAEKEKLRKAEAAKLEAEQRATLGAYLATMPPVLQTAIAALPSAKTADAVRKEGKDGLTKLNGFLKGAVKTAKAATIKAMVDETTALIKKVDGFSPPLTPAQRRQRRVGQIKTNVENMLKTEKWLGVQGGQLSVTVDKTDNDMWNAVNTEFGRDRVEITDPELTAKSYPGKTSTSKLYYYVTHTSQTPSIAYDISVHVYEGTVQTGTAIVLHIPNGTN